MLRIPAKRNAAKALRAYFVGDAARAKVVGEHVILDLFSEDVDPEYDKESQGSLGALVPVRAELMRGDLRVAYLAWLLAVQSNEVADDVVEPTVPEGLSSMTAHVVGPGERERGSDRFGGRRLPNRIGGRCLPNRPTEEEPTHVVQVPP